MRRLITGAIDSIVDAVDARGGLREMFAQLIRGKITDRDDGTSHCENLSQPDVELVWDKNVVGVDGNAVFDAKEIFNPKRGPSGHAGKMCVKMMDANFLQSDPDVSCLVEAQ